MADRRHRNRHRALRRGRSVASLIPAAVALAVTATACISPPLPAESIEVSIDLEPAESQTLSFRTVVSSLTDGHLEITMRPFPNELEARGIEVSQRSIIDGGAPLDVWPDRFDQARIETEAVTTVDFDVELINASSEVQSVELVVQVQADSGSVPQPFPDEVTITLSER